MTYPHLHKLIGSPANQLHCIKHCIVRPTKIMFCNADVKRTNLEGGGHDQITVFCGILLKELRRTTKYFGEDSECLDRDSNGAPPECYYTDQLGWWNSYKRSSIRQQVIKGKNDNSPMSEPAHGKFRRRKLRVCWMSTWGQPTLGCPSSWALRTGLIISLDKNIAKRYGLSRISNYIIDEYVIA
jgi:hypothetical protein